MDNNITLLQKPKKSAIFIGTHLPAEDPRDISARAIARFRTGIALARQLRDEWGRANVLIVVYGGWPLYQRLPLAVHHAYAAVHTHKLLDTKEIDLIASYGVNTVTDLHGTLAWMNENILRIQDAYVVTSNGHAARLTAESDMYSLFPHIYHVETNEPRGDTDEDVRWLQRAVSIPPHQYIVSGRASDVTRFGSMDSLIEAQKMEAWACQYPVEHRHYTENIWRFMADLEANNVVVRCQTPGCWRICINC